MRLSLNYILSEPNILYIYPFIGFTIYQRFNDYRPIECLLKTIEINDLGDKVWNGLKHIPYNIKSDLVVCNPPQSELEIDLNWVKNISDLRGTTQIFLK